MKKSNKLLVGGFLSLLLFISAIHITLYAKYKSGDYVVYNTSDDVIPQAMQSFPNIAFVSVRHVPGATVKFSNVAAVSKEENEGLSYVQKGDTLLITGKDSSGQQRAGYPVNFDVPYNATVSVFNSSVIFETDNKTAETNPVIYLQKSQAVFSGTGRPFQLGNLKLIASDNSTALFQGNTDVRQLDVHLLNSSIEYSEGNFGRLSIATDSSSRISLQSKHLLKANIKHIVPQ